MTKIVSKNSSEVVLKDKVGYFKGMDGFGVFGLPLISNVISFFAVAVPISNTPGWDIPSSILMGVVTGTVLPFIGGKYWNAYQVVEELKDHTGTTFGKTAHRAAAKTFLNSLLPFGQTFKTGSKIVGSYQVPEDLIGGSSSADRYYSYRDTPKETYQAETYVRFTPFGSEIKQSISPTPITVWDEAFNSTVAVHEFKLNKQLASSSR